MFTRLYLASVLLLAAFPLMAGPEGRYQAIPIDPGQGYGAEKALILDTVGGHLWIWIESAAAETEPGGRYLIYQGQLTPGKEMGEIIEKQEWPPRPPEEVKLKE